MAVDRVVAACPGLSNLSHLSELRAARPLRPWLKILYDLSCVRARTTGVALSLRGAAAFQGSGAATFSAEQ